MKFLKINNNVTIECDSFVVEYPDDFLIKEFPEKEWPNKVHIYKNGKHEVIKIFGDVFKIDEDHWFVRERRK